VLVQNILDIQGNIKSVKFDFRVVLLKPSYTTVFFVCLFVCFFILLCLFVFLYILISSLPVMYFNGTKHGNKVVKSAKFPRPFFDF